MIDFGLKKIDKLLGDSKKKQMVMEYRYLKKMVAILY
jgi:hypothetical protein